MTAAASLTASSGRDTEAARQQAIVAALFAPERAAARALVAGAGVRGTPEAMEAGLGAYRGNGIAIAERALQATYPVTFGLLGESAESAAAHLWRADPPRTGDLADWGAGFADWLAAQPSLADWPQLAGCARIEWARHCAERAVDAGFDVGSLALLGTHTPDVLRLRLRPGVAVIRGSAGFYQTWLDSSGCDQGRLARGTAACGVDVAVRDLSTTSPSGTAETAVLVWREGFAPRTEPLDAHRADWLSAVAAGAPLRVLLETLPEADLETVLASLISRGLLLDIVTHEDNA